MPAFLRPLSEHQPITPVIETVRGLLTGTPVDRGWAALAWTVGVLVVAFVVAVRLYRSRTSR
jgi:ABC-2 type transport system permease protein